MCVCVGFKIFISICVFRLEFKFSFSSELIFNFEKLLCCASFPLLPHHSLIPNNKSWVWVGKYNRTEQKQTNKMTTHQQMGNPTSVALQSFNKNIILKRKNQIKSKRMQTFIFTHSHSHIKSFYYFINICLFVLLCFFVFSAIGTWSFGGLYSACKIANTLWKNS